jgi:M6 family metalloprotease-like protein
VTGKRKGLVILVNFQDTKMMRTHTQTEWNDYFNLKGYSKLNNSGSVHDYFYNQSYGLFDLEFDVVGPVTVSKKMAAYGANDAYGNDVDPAGMVYEACQLAADQVNFADYDWDGDGEVDQVYLIYAGYGEAANSNTLANTIWQHEWNLEEAGYSLTIDGVRINTYGCSSELNGDSGSYMDGIGTACHEFSHCLGIPDLYDTSGNGNYGMDEWDLYRGRIREYAEQYPGVKYVEGARPWGEKADIALPSATQNEINGDDAKKLIANGVMAVSEGANMPSTPEAIKVFQEAKILYAPGKAANAGGVSVSGLEMTQNSIKLGWSAEEVDEKLKSIMKNIHEACVQYGTEADGYVNYVKGANVAGFMKVAKAMMSQGIL